MVDFGTVPGTVVSDTANQIVAISPAESAGTVNVTVTTTAGTSPSSAADQFTYTPTSPILLAVIPNTGTALQPNQVLTTAPTQLTLKFNQNEVIDAATATTSNITLKYTPAAGTVTDGTVNLGTPPSLISYIGVDDTAANEIDVRFSQTLLSGTYTINIGAGLMGADSSGVEKPFQPTSSLNTVPGSLSFNLSPGSLVTSVVPQPVSRTSTGTLQQAINEVDVYFSSALNPVSASNPQYYQLIGTDDSANSVVNSCKRRPPWSTTRPRTKRNCSSRRARPTTRTQIICRPQTRRMT